MTEAELLSVLQNTLLTGAGDKGAGAVPIALPSNPTSMNGLQQVISTAIREARNGANGNPPKEIKEEIDNRKKLNTETKNSTNALKKHTETTDAATKATKEYTEVLKENDKVSNKLNI